MTNTVLKIIYIVLLIPLLLADTMAGGSGLEKLWEVDGLNNPESVVYDPVNDVLYVSNVNGAPDEKDANGFISKVSLAGEVINKQWVTGLDAPKGLAIANNKLYIADIDTLVEIDIPSSSISNRYTVTDAKFLNDVAASVRGQVFVSDMVMNRIHSLDNDRFSIWLESPDLLNPNGLHVQGDRLIVGAWGAMTDGVSKELPGHLLAVSLVDKTISSIGDGSSIGNLDGVEEDTDGSFYVTDWMAGKLFHISPAGRVDLLLTLEQGMADHELLPDKGLILLPMMMNNKLLAYRIY
jgi:sugar lactone lactonase YvrE